MCVWKGGGVGGGGDSRVTDYYRAVYRADLYTQSRTCSRTLRVRSSVLDGK